MLAMPIFNQMKKITAVLAVIIFSISCSQKISSARIILLPDTQTYAEKYPAVLDSQVNWILQHKEKVSFVLQQGDLTQNNNHKEWTVIKNAFTKLNSQVPYALAAGNHDMGSADGKFADVRNSELFNTYFPVNTMKLLPGFAGSAENKTDNAFYILKTGKINWLILTLEFGPRNSILKWADSVVKKYPAHTVIVNTHSYMYSDSTRQGPGDNWRPQAYGVGKNKGDSAVNDGEDIWTKLVKINPNIRFVFSGHVLNSGVGTLISINDSGYPVYQMLANYQEGVKNSVNGGNGWLRIIDLNFKKRTLKVSTWSPYVKRFMDDPQHNFFIRNLVW